MNALGSEDAAHHGLIVIVLLARLVAFIHNWRNGWILIWIVGRMWFTYDVMYGDVRRLNRSFIIALLSAEESVHGDDDTFCLVGEPTAHCTPVGVSSGIPRETALGVAWDIQDTHQRKSPVPGYADSFDSPDTIHTKAQSPTIVFLGTGGGG